MRRLVVIGVLLLCLVGAGMVGYSMYRRYVCTADLPPSWVSALPARAEALAPDPSCVRYVRETLEERQREAWHYRGG
jgi:hypothetical protein